MGMVWSALLPESGKNQGTERPRMDHREALPRQRALGILLGREDEKMTLQHDDFTLTLLRSLNFQKKLILKVMEKMVGWFTSGEIYREYSKAALELGIRPLSIRTVRDYLLEMHYLGLIQSKKEKGRRLYSMEGI